MGFDIVKLKVLAVIVASLLAIPAFGQDFVVGMDGCCDSLVNQWPGGEAPGFAIDGFGQKYLNFGELNTGILVSPAAGSAAPTSLKLWAANDAEPRDPASYQVWGTNAAPLGFAGDPGQTFPLSLFTAISTGDVTLPASRNNGGTAEPLDDANSFSVSFDNTDAYSRYLIVFPTVKDADAANSMQIAEVQLYDAAGDGIFAPDNTIFGGQVVPVPEPSTGLLALLCMIPVISYIRRRR